MRNELHRTGLSQLPQGMDSCRLFIVDHDFVGWNSVHLVVFTIRIEAELILFVFLLGLDHFAAFEYFCDDIVKDELELRSNGIGNQIEEGETRLSHFRVSLVFQNPKHDLHNRHYVVVVE